MGNRVQGQKSFEICGNALTFFVVASSAGVTRGTVAETENMGGVNSLDRKLFKQNGIEGERMKTGALCNGAICGMEREQ